MTESLRIAWSALDSQTLGIIRGAVAIAGALVLTWDLRTGPGPTPQGRHRLRNVLLGVLGVIALLCWWNLGRLHYSAGYLQINDHYHYYLGSKYASELGY